MEMSNVWRTAGIAGMFAAMVAVEVEAVAEVRLSSMIGDNMVLQQNSNARIWGTADPGEKVTVIPSWDGKKYETVTDRTGDWSLAVATPAGLLTPMSMQIYGEGGPARNLNNILIGEVWLASGQSNMEMPLSGFDGCIVKDGYKEIAAANDYAGKVRFFTVPKAQSFVPLDTVNSRWTVPSPDTAPQYSAVGWHFAKQLSDVLQVPVGIVSDAYGGAKVESWMPRDVLRNYPDINLDEEAVMVYQPDYHRPMLMYNAMFNPVKNYTYRGILWYQGCSNVGLADTYAERLAAMVRTWRDEIGLGDIPFYAVEIAPYDYGDDQSPYLRLAQWDAVKRITNADMICTNDLVRPNERFNIHPGDKESVGRRLCDLALNKTYGKKQFLAGSPRYKGHRVDGDKMIVAINSPNKGACSNYDIRGFEIAGQDGVFHTVKPEDVTFLWQTNEFQLTSPEVKHPMAVRYGFRDFLPGTVYGGNHLPLIPFTSEIK